MTKEILLKIQTIRTDGSSVTALTPRLEARQNSASPMTKPPSPFDRDSTDANEQKHFKNQTQAFLPRP